MEASVCTVIFFRAFDLAEFFKPKEGDPCIHFLEQRTSRLSRGLFGYEGAVKNPPITPICDNQVMGNTNNWQYLSQNKEEEERAYAAGWVRGTLLDRFFAPIFKYQPQSVFGIIPLVEEPQNVCQVYQTQWIDSNSRIHSCLSEANLTLSISPYGIASVRLELNVSVGRTATQVGNRPEFHAVQQAVTPLFYSKPAREALEKLYSGAVGFPNFLNFLALCAIWQFLKELESKKETCKDLGEWFGDVGTLKVFDKLWERCTKRPFPLRQEAAYFYFEDSSYDQESNPSFPDRNHIEGICQLGLLVAPDQTATAGTGQALFANEVKDKFGEKDLCVTDNGCAFVLGGSLIVAVRDEKYQLQGSEATERNYWRWMFRLLCCIRECFILCDIGSRDIRKLREGYEVARAKCFKNGDLASDEQEKDFGKEGRRLLDELAQVASLLFMVEEGTHTVVASRVPFVQEKLRAFVEHLGLPDLLENVNKRRQRLEERIHNEMGRLLQGVMDRVSGQSLYATRVSLGVAIAALLVAGVTLFDTYYSGKEHDKLEKNLIGAVEKLPENIGQGDVGTYGKRAAEALESIRDAKSPPLPICCPQR